MHRQLIPIHDNWADMRQRFRWNIPMHFNIAERCCDSHALARPDALAIRHITQDRQTQDWTYRDLKKASDALALSLLARGVSPGDRVAVLLAQCPEVLVTHFAAQKIGAIILPLFTLFGPDALQYRLSDSGTRALVTDAANLDKLDGLDLPDLDIVYSIDPCRSPVLSFQDEIAKAHGKLAPVQTLADDPATLIYTSGTTGPPKGVLHAHRFLLGHLPSIETTHTGFPVVGDKGWTPADWAWIGGLMDMAIPCLYYGVPLISHRMRRFDADAAFDLIARENIRNLFMPPTALKMMRDTTPPAASNIRSITSGGESLGADLLNWGQTTLRAPINEIYGQTECNLVLASVAATMDIRPGSMGQAVPGMDVAVIDQDGREVEAGELGEIAVRRGTPVMFLNYWNQPEKTAAKFSGEWMRTGDLGQRDEQGYFTYVSRDDDIINSAGYRIGPSEIEHCLAGDPDVIMAAVVGLPDPARGEVVAAFVTLRQDAPRDGVEARLINRVKARISPHVAPRSVTIVDELPLTATGKIMRRALRETP